MTNDSVIDAVASEFRNFHLEDIEDEAADVYRNHCIHGELFQRRTDAILAKYVYDQPTLVSLAKAKVLLFDQFIETWMLLPKSHRNTTGSGRHVCVFQVLVQAMLNVRLAQSHLTELQFMLPTPPPQSPAPPAPALLGITLGEVLGEE